MKILNNLDSKYWLKLSEVLENLFI